MLRLTRVQLAEAAKVSESALASFETGGHQPHPRTLKAIRSVLEGAGVEFISENGGGPGVRLWKGAVRQQPASHGRRWDILGDGYFRSSSELGLVKPSEMLATSRPALCQAATSSVDSDTPRPGQWNLSQGDKLSAAQCRMARAALLIEVRELAESAKVSRSTIARLECGESLYPRTVEAIRAVLEAGGVEFIEESGGGSGVRLPKP